MNGVLPEMENGGKLCLSRVEAPVSLLITNYSQAADKDEFSVFKTCLSVCVCMYTCEHILYIHT